MKKYRKYLSLLLALVMTMSLCVPALAAFDNLALATRERAQYSKSLEKTTISFESSATIREIEEIVTNNDIVLNEFTATILSGKNDITCGFVIREQDSFSNLWDDFCEQQEALLVDAIIANAENSEILEDIMAVREAIESNSIRIDTLICCGNVLEDSSNLNDLDIVREVKVYDKNTVSAENVAPQEYTQATEETNWLPTSGTAYAWPSGTYDDATYLQINYMWNSAYAMSTLTNNTNSTLEAEIVLYNYDGSAISDAWNTNYSYVTNQPRAYRDTQAFDNSNECCFTIGCARASDLEAGTQYYWYAYGNRTDSDSCKAKVYFQRGHRVISDNYSTWNIFADETLTVVQYRDWNTGTATYKDF